VDAPPIPTTETCVFIVDGTRYESAPADPFTIAVANEGLSVQCVAIVGSVRYTLGLASSSKTTGDSTALGSFSEQPAAGGDLTSQIRDFSAKVSVVSRSPMVTGTAQFSASSAKKITASFNLPNKP